MRLIDADKLIYEIKNCLWDWESINGITATAVLKQTISDIESQPTVCYKEQEKEIKALRLLVEWATECDFGFDQFRDEYERYKDEIKDMKYIDGMIHVAKRTLEDHGAFEKGC